MNKRIFIFVGFTLLLTVMAFSVYAAQDNTQEDVLWINGNLPSMTFDELTSEADMIARVQIVELVDTLPYPGELEMSKIRAKVLKYYKNNTTTTEDEIYFYQLSSPTVQFRQNPLLNVNQSYVLFLKESDTLEEESLFNEPKILHIVGEGYGRYNVMGENIAPQIQPKGQEITGSPIPIIEFEKKLEVKLKLGNKN